MPIPRVESTGCCKAGEVWGILQNYRQPEVLWRTMEWLLTLVILLGSLFSRTFSSVMTSCLWEGGALCGAEFSLARPSVPDMAVGFFDSTRLAPHGMPETRASCSFFSGSSKSSWVRHQISSAFTGTGISGFLRAARRRLVGPNTLNQRGPQCDPDGAMAAVADWLSCWVM